MLKNTINKIVLVPGHGKPSDPGAVNGNFHEADQTRFIMRKVAELLRSKGIAVDTMPENFGSNASNGNEVLQQHINWINNNYNPFVNNSANNVLAIELHRDSAAGLDYNDASKRMGVYFYQDDKLSSDVANQMVAVMEREGAHSNSWARPHGPTTNRPYPLGFIEKTEPFSLIIEHAFMQGDNSNDHLNWLATVSAKAIYEVLTGQKFDEFKPPVEPPKPPQPPIQPPVNNNAFKEEFVKKMSDEPAESIPAGTRDAVLNSLNSKDLGYPMRELNWAYQTINGLRSAPKFHIQNEDGLNDWVGKHAVNRLNERGIRTYRAEQYDALNAEIEKLRADSQVILSTPDKLDDLNVDLIAENEMLSKELKSAQTENEKLKTNQNSSKKPFWQSKKFWALMIGVVYTVIARFDPTLATQAQEIMLVIIAYIFGQSFVDSAYGLAKPQN